MGKAKEPWQMTKEEASERTFKRYVEDIRRVGKTKIANRAEAMGYKRLAQGNDDFAKRLTEHSTIVKQALQKGKLVPAEVLADCPQLPKSNSILIMKVKVEIPNGRICNNCPLLGAEDVCNLLRLRLNWDDVAHLGAEESEIVWFKHPDCPSLIVS